MRAQPIVHQAVACFTAFAPCVIARVDCPQFDSSYCMSLSVVWTRLKVALVCKCSIA